MMPCLTVRHVRAAQDFYARAFGFEKGTAVRDEHGHVVHGEVRWKDAAFMLGPEDGDCLAPVSSGHRAAGKSVLLHRGGRHHLRQAAEGKDRLDDPSANACTRKSGWRGQRLSAADGHGGP